MDYLAEFANSPLVREVAEIALRSPLVQGVILDIDPYWLLGWRLFTTSPATLEALEVHYGDWLFMNPDEAVWPDWPTSGYELFPQPIRLADLHMWRPPRWAEYSRHFRFKPDEVPFVIRLYLRPSESDNEVPPPLFTEYPIRVITETRPVATLFSNPRKRIRPLVGGVSVGESTNPPGTLGGILRDAIGNRFGLTCAHVIKTPALSIEQPAPADNLRASGVIGKSTTISALAANIGTACNPWANGVLLNDVDVALVQLDQAVASMPEVLDVGTVNSITPRSSLSPGQTVEMMGRSSGHKLLRLGGLAVTFRLYGGGQFYCFTNLFELRSQTKWQLLRSRPIRPGDSGAWVCNANGWGFGWCGMVIGGDRVSGYAVFSQNIQTWWQLQGLSLFV